MPALKENYKQASGNFHSNSSIGRNLLVKLLRCYILVFVLLGNLVKGKGEYIRYSTSSTSSKGVIHVFGK